jgi:hypothetical protein
MRHAMVGRWDRLCQTAGMVDLHLTLLKASNPTGVFLRLKLKVREIKPWSRSQV